MKFQKKILFVCFEKAWKEHVYKLELITVTLFVYFFIFHQISIYTRFERIFKADAIVSQCYIDDYLYRVFLKYVEKIKQRVLERK